METQASEVDGCCVLPDSLPGRLLRFAASFFRVSENV